MKAPRLALKLGFLVGGLELTNHFVVARLDHFLHAELVVPFVVFVGIWACAIVALLGVAFAPSLAARLGWALPIGLSTLAEEWYFRVVEDRLTIEALDAMLASRALGLEAAVFYGHEIGLAVVGTTLVVGGLLSSPYPTGRWRGRSAALLPLAPCGLVAGVILHAAASGGYETRGLPSQFHGLALASVYALDSPPDPTKGEVTISRVTGPAARHVVLIVDESVRGDFIDLNRGRGTTPYLASQPHRPINFGLATAASNCSNSSNAILRLGANPERLGRGDDALLSHPSIWKYARAAGYETNYVEAEPLAEGSYNFMRPAEVRLIDRVLTVPQGVPVAFRDFELAQILVDVLARTEPQFVYVNKQGAHFPYGRLVVAGDARFLPTMGPLEPIADRERLVNAYKNAVRRTVDRFFRDLLPRVDWSRAVLIYTSDHGQNLLDDGKPVTHCRRAGESLHEAIVPLIAWAGDGTLRRRLERAASVNFDAASHFEVFPTLLVLFGYDPATVRERYHQSLFEEIEMPLGFLSGPITGRFGRKPSWNSRAGLAAHRRASR